MNQFVRCGFCGYEFNWDRAQTACTACPLARGCHLVCCPQCGYQMPPEAKLVGWLRHLRQNWQLKGFPFTHLQENEETLPNLMATEAQEAANHMIAPLGKLQPGQGGHIAYLQMNNLSHLQKLMAMGVLPGVPLTLLHRFPSYVFETGYSQFAVDEKIANDIYVRLTPNRA
jgi:Fe2+ transport system protein FeoA